MLNSATFCISTTGHSTTPVSEGTTDGTTQQNTEVITDTTPTTETTETTAGLEGNGKCGI